MTRPRQAPPDDAHELFGYVGPDNSTLCLYLGFASVRPDGKVMWKHKAATADAAQDNDREQEA